VRQNSAQGLGWEIFADFCLDLRHFVRLLCVHLLVEMGESAKLSFERRIAF